MDDWQKEEEDMMNVHQWLTETTNLETARVEIDKAVSEHKLPLLTFNRSLSTSKYNMQSATLLMKRWCSKNNWYLIGKPKKFHAMGLWVGTFIEKV